MELFATVVITSKNRKDDLRKAIASALEQTAKPEVLVIDDGSTDGTLECVRREFPQVRIHRDEQSKGYIVQRNQAARLASAPILFSMDDDAVFSSPTIVEETIKAFSHPRVGAVAIPFINVNQSLEEMQRAPATDAIYAAYSYIGTAHALRRDLFLALGGYREMLVHQGEEEDYCIHLLNAGFIARCGIADPIHHFESPLRNWSRMDFYGARNKILYAWQNVPMPNLPIHLAGTTRVALAHTLNPARFWRRLRAVSSGYALVLAGASCREPVKLATYRLSRLLKRRKAVPLEEIEAQLPPMNFKPAAQPVRLQEKSASR
jgi:glycosyltransferase involved in cell wall biosynthesis